ncbi:ribose 5-phosphate isomerase A [Thermoleophilum album]|uniref:ribose 5-phosphate isomerase A n=1 Tax=Thermoleophilum album TaxID=29539 RepID=UPI00237CB4FE|nr:ribose 5-phosphate isomerase A [Thermoleophilum album]WDT94353.1 ribose 5-phosphate isomerase A [Thermoleophilum album]
MASGGDLSTPARDAAARAALALVPRGGLVALGSGRAVWRLCELIAGERAPAERPRAVVASERTRAVCENLGIAVADLDGREHPARAFDGADEVDPDLRLLKGAGGALLRERIAAAAAGELVVMVEEEKLVGRLGERFPLPVEIVRFGWRATLARLATLLAEPRLRCTEEGEPFVTDEGHFLVDGRIPPTADLDGLARALRETPGVCDHGLFLSEAALVLVGDANGSVRELGREPLRRRGT